MGSFWGAPEGAIITDSTGNELVLEANGSMPVTLQDQTTPPVILPLSRLIAEDETAVETVEDAYTITLADSTGFIAGNLVFIANVPQNEIMFCEQVGAPAGNVITIDRPIDYAFPVGSYVSTNSTNMAVDGSITPVIFSLRPGTVDVPLTVDVTRVMIGMHTSTAVDLSKFGDLAALTYGVTLRRVDGVKSNIFNIKSNGELASIAYDIRFYDAQNANQGQHGLISRLTFAGQNKMGVAIRIGPDEDLQLIIHDDLTGLLNFTIVAEGSIALVG